MAARVAVISPVMISNSIIPAAVGSRLGVEVIQAEVGANVVGDAVADMGTFPVRVRMFIHNLLGIIRTLMVGTPLGNINNSGKPLLYPIQPYQETGTLTETCVRVFLEAHLTL
ncbi:hypothetical protein L2E82_45309 [Cichorium intybus]|uniref:Uncharacterized protein n=3 Tax=Cichorium intybus TaxID=13427 RepID=A0ACB8ZRM7_CICIN|nr:hypothetical protein L2E82_45283 [Cichorium intybus]KAI3700663.1 hypothetical protein L2E82_45300 [Cichorium intybus]KAI3700672.1 hypothetical protein L2E82_45309 [Cichorium intybus]